MRTPLKAPAPKWPGLTEQEQNTISVDLETITPMFGGGFEPRIVDAQTPVRSASVRGHLRFWWRAVVGTRPEYATPAQLAAAEAELWGSATLPGKAAVSVRITQHGTDAPYGRQAGANSPRQGPGLGFFLFPFQPDRQQDAATGRQGIGFTVTISFSPLCTQIQRRDVEKAFSTWIAFGGIGARTRRGCGALTTTDTAWLPAAPPQFEDWLRSKVETTGLEANFSTLQNARGIIGPAQSDASTAWLQLARFWAAFRKGHVANNYTPTNGSFWNDYDTVSDAGHEPGIALGKPFLGLPIIYQQGRKYSGVVEPAGSSRMASPVILKPIKMANQRYYPLVLVLSAPAPASVKLKDGNPRKLRVPSADPVLRELNCTEPLEAVLAAAQRWFDPSLHFAVGENR